MHIFLSPVIPNYLHKLMHSDENCLLLRISLTERKTTLEIIEKDKECIGIEHIFGVLVLSHIYQCIMVLVL